MKICPNCKTELDDSARFCLSCMTSLDDKEQIQPPIRKKRWWLLIVIICAVLCAVSLAVIMNLMPSEPPKSQETTTTTNGTTTTTTTTAGTTLAPSSPAGDVTTRSYTVGGVTYTFRPTTEDEHPTAIKLENYFTLIRVEGTPTDGIYRVPSFVGDDMNSLVTVVADGAFDGTNAESIDLGYNVRYVWGNAFGGYSLTELYLHEDVFVEQAAFSGCSGSLTIHCPEYIENTEGFLWWELADIYGFQWQSALI